MNIHVQVLCEYASIFLRKMIRVRILLLLLLFWEGGGRNCQILSKAAVPLYTTTSNVREIHFLFLSMI
jgi:hypothetical protein